MADYFEKKGVRIYSGDAADFYAKWPSPVVIVADGPYGVSGFPGDPPTHEGLGRWYEPHIKAWSEMASPLTTLWFWNTEVGWATVHPVLEKYGWKYRSCNIWDKGNAHIAGNANTKSLRKLPVVTEVCAQYVKEPTFKIEDRVVPTKEWLRHEWKRSGLPFSKTNEACGVKDAATRKYFTDSHLWYFPPPEAMAAIAAYANHHGLRTDRPYFSLNGKTPITEAEWKNMRSKFACPFGITNVWREPALRGEERIKVGLKALHLNQKPLKLVRMTIEVSSDPGDVVWEPFGGLCTAAVAAQETGRHCYAAEIDQNVYRAATERVSMVAGRARLALAPA